MDKTIGILLDHQTFLGVPRKRTGSEQISLYNKAAKQLQLKPFYMSLKRTGKTNASGYTFKAGKYRAHKGRIPHVIHNRAITLSPRWRKKLSGLAKQSVVFNRKNRYSKYKIAGLLAEKPSLRAYLPATVKYSSANLRKAMSEYGSIFVKPVSGSVGSGIMKLAKRQDGRWLVYTDKGKRTGRSSREALLLVDRIVGKQSYLIQEGIALATCKGRPYDIRVSVQRGADGVWQITGMVGKVAGAGRHVTNVAKGGKVKRCEELFQLSGLPLEQTKKALAKASLDIVAYLGEKLPHLADVGLDMGVDKAGGVKFIEMNGRDQRYSFKKAGMRQTFFKTYLTPLQYGKSLFNKPQKVQESATVAGRAPRKRRP